MAMRISGNLPGAPPLERMTRRPLFRAVGACLIAVGAAGYFVASAASAQSAPAPDTSPWIISNVGTTGTDQTGQQGGQATGIFEFTDTLIYPSINFASIGGTGGTGYDSSDTTGPGGAGGNSGWVNLNMQEAVISSNNVATPGNPNAAVWLRSLGGTGGTAGKMRSSFGSPGMPGAGGASGGVQFTQNWNIWSTAGWNGSQAGTTAVLLQANGGDAAEPLGTDGAEGAGKMKGANGGAGGAGGPANYSLTGMGSVISQGSAVVVQSAGGQGGDGTLATSTVGEGYGGDGGAGGNGGDVSASLGQAQADSDLTSTISAVGAPTAATGSVVVVDTSGNTAEAADLAAGVLAQSLGGVGGAGGLGDGTTSRAGSGGAAGSAGNVNVTVQNVTNISTTGFAAAGIVAQSVGGAGGNGAGAGGIFYKKAGNGGMGGAAGDVQVNLGYSGNTTWPSNLVSTIGDDSIGVIAQSIGGGGGVGGAVSAGSLLAGVAIGGNGEAGGVAGIVNLFNGMPAVNSNPTLPGFIVSTLGQNSSGLVAQSIGGGGGTGGSAQNTSLGAFNYTVGGNGGSGGSAGLPGMEQVGVVNLGIVNTVGGHAKGIVAQAIGGGGGDGGAAMAQSASDMLNVQVTVGGSGGTGGSAGDVAVQNRGQLLTNGSDAYGVLAQSISGGGGNGGSSVSDVFQLPGANEVPQLTINTSVGGNGGDGSPSGNVTASNDEVIMTAGASSHGILAQSITNGGGNGGDSSALTIGAQTGPSLTVTTSVGGSGGGAAQAGNVTATNDGSSMIWTLGDSADGIFAQSIGGGGGNGGTAKATTEFLGPYKGGSSQLNMNLGGTGGNGSSGGTVTATNNGNMLTMGDNSAGIFAQSVGGGGGSSQGGTEKGAGGSIKETITVTGNSSAAANGGAVNVTNNGGIVTFGGDSAGILAQSVGGGGGKAGTGSTAGPASADLTLSGYLAASTILKGAVQSLGGVETFTAGAFSNVDPFALTRYGNDYLSYAASHTPAGSDANDGVVSTELNVGGGTNGDQGPAAAGNGGAVTVTNTTLIQTGGPASSAMVAQSIGGGGGIAGATATNAQQSSSGNTANFVMNLGSRTDNAGDGGTVQVTNSGMLTTAGDASFGMYAQSVGGGGGETVMTASNYTPDGKPMPISIAAGVLTLGTGGDVTANHGGHMETLGNDAVGIVAQSIGGSGGTAIVMQTGANAAGQAMGVTNPNADPTGADHRVWVGSNEVSNSNWFACAPVQTGISYNTCGNGGQVTVTTGVGSTISTSGRNAHGILAQSIGGGGGWIVGLSEANGSNPFDAPMMAGNGGEVQVTVWGTVTTTGAGAYGVLAQSVGGGGILGGDLANAGGWAQLPGSTNGDDNRSRAGNGGGVYVGNVGTISTTGARAHAIFAQSIGGGGGTWATSSADPTQVGNLVMGTAGGIGDSSGIGISNSGTVSASGQGASAIYVDAEGQNHQTDVEIYNNSNATIAGNSSAPAINLMGYATNGNGTVNNSGTITNAGGTAVNVQDYGVVNNKAGGTLIGDLYLGSTGSLNNDGTWATGTYSNLGMAINLGTIVVNGAVSSMYSSSTLAGSLTEWGAIQTNIDFYSKLAGYLDVQGSLYFNANASVVLKPQSLAPGVPVAIMGANSYAGPLPKVTDTGSSYLFDYTPSYDGEGDLLVQASQLSRFAKTASGIAGNANLLSGAAYLDGVWSNGVSQSMAQTFARLSAVSNATQYLSALQGLGNEGVAAASVNHVVTSNAFVERMNSCPRFDGDMTQSEHDCAWGRVISNSTDQDVANDSFGYHQSGQVFQLGGQKEVADDWFVGGSVSSDHTSLSATAAAGSVSGEGWTAGLVAKRQMSDWLVSAALEGGEMSYRSTRYTPFYDIGGTARGKFDVTHWGIHSRISRQFAFDHWYLKPYIDLHATHINSDSYTEQGGGAFDMKVAGSSSNVLGASPMLEAGSKFDIGQDTTLQVYAGVGGAFYNQGSLSTDMQLADQPGPVYFSQSSTLPKERLKTTAGLDLKTGDHWDVRLEYSGESANHLDSDTGALKVSYKF